MEICRIKINNFRGIKTADILLNGNAVLVGDNNTGKSTVFEAIDLVLGPDRIARHPVIDEHDFYAGEYLIDNTPVEITVEVVVIGLNEEQLRHFGSYIEWWDKAQNDLLKGPPATDTEKESVVPALRVLFKGSYDPEEDDFDGQTYFALTMKDGGIPSVFRTKDKRYCGFLYLRTLRTGSRALSLERGSLLDIILQLKELRPQMWEKVINQLRSVSVATDPELGMSDILASVQSSLSTIVSYETAESPQIRVSNLTREHLRKVLTVFLGSGVIDSHDNEYTTPYYHQGTGTINTLVLTLLSMIADIKENVIFAMEEPEIALPPHIQKRVVLSVIERSNQALFTSHSPYVIEELPANQILVVSRTEGTLSIIPANMPPTVKAKSYREEIRRRFCESLLARRVLITEGRTEYDVYTTAARKLQSLHPDRSLSFELLGISLVNAGTDSQIPGLGEYYRKLNKTVYAVCDKQKDDAHKRIVGSVDYCYEAPEHGIENVVLKGIKSEILIKYGEKLVTEGYWPTHLSAYCPNNSMTEGEIYNALFEYFKWSKGEGTLADLIQFCPEEDMPQFITNTVYEIAQTVYPPKDIETIVPDNEESDEVVQIEENV
jgi:putative ATP-dependent endonuclease of OLD family